ncbi:hypothetical protein [Serratia silvae]|uniref:Uncharacterized protein n=1 Tax=Serratia silvae TaxID=2824122 RepID=A0ABT0KHB5_9GAMM|nr:hypothetical protein [Serratia silvae]MCL1031410.1 hypothetical protein [Serratia silvae]
MNYEFWEIYREGWNGKAQMVFRAGGHAISKDCSASGYAKAGIVGESIIQPHLVLKNAQGLIQPGWGLSLNV